MLYLRYIPYNSIIFLNIVLCDRYRYISAKTCSYEICIYNKIWMWKVIYHRSKYRIQIISILKAIKSKKDLCQYLNSFLLLACNSTQLCILFRPYYIYIFSYISLPRYLLYIFRTYSSFNYKFLISKVKSLALTTR